MTNTVNLEQYCEIIKQCFTAGAEVVMGVENQK